MQETDKLTLPASGLAEDILEQFVVEEQRKLDRVSVERNLDETEQIYHLVTFTVANEEYGVEIANVQEIIRATDITPVPGAPVHVKGVINLRGKIIPVVELRRRFGLPEVEATDEQRIVVVEHGEKRLGMHVDSVSQVIKLSSSVIEDMPEEATSVDGNYIMGVGKMEDRLIIILDLTRSLLLG
jgi:purine-binding chemotaxis protein CheW